MCIIVSPLVSNQVLDSNAFDSPLMSHQILDFGTSDLALLTLALAWALILHLIIESREIEGKAVCKCVGELRIGLYDQVMATSLRPCIKSYY